MFGGQKAAILAQVGHFYSGRWVSFTSAATPLTDVHQLPGERQALSDLFAGAIGSYKNPHSHRSVSLTDPEEAQEMVLLASHRSASWMHEGRLIEVFERW